MAPALRKSLKWLLGTALVLVILVALLLGAFGFIVGRVPQYRVQLQDWINERSGLAVEFRTLSARLRLYGPELVFNDAVVRTPDRTRVLATARRGSVGFDLWASIGSGRLTAGRFTLQSPQIGLIRTQEGRIQLLGQSALNEREDAKPFAIEQLPTGRFQVENALLSFRDQVTRRGPWSLSGVSFELTRRSDSMRLQGGASLPRTLGRKLTFGATVEGPLDRSQALVSAFRVEGEGLDLAGWADVLPDAWPVPETGNGSLHVRGALKGSTLVQLSAQVDLKSITAVPPSWTTPLPTAAPMQQPGDDHAEQAQAMPAAPGEATTVDVTTSPQMLSYSRVAFALRAQRLGDAWSVSISDLDLAKPQSSWRAREIKAHWSGGEGGLLKVSAQAERLVLENLWPLLAYLPESPALARVRALNAAGTIEDLSFDYQRKDNAAAPTYSGKAQLAGLSFEPIERVPGMSGLGGSLRMTEREGEWHVAARDAGFELPRMFREPLVAKSLDGKVTWRQTEAGWQVGSDEIRVGSDDGRAVARFSATLPRDGSLPVLDASARGEDLKVSATRKYIPAGRLGARTMQWLDRAFVDGRVTGAQFVYKGPIRSFPFRNGEGLFLVRAHVEHALFDYQPGWMPANDISADVEFRNQAMHIRSSAARVGGLQVADATADIADLKQGHIVIKAAARGDVDNALKLLQESPLAPKLGEPFARLAGQGPVSTNVYLYLPIRNLAARKVEVTARFANASVSLQNIDAPVKGLSGTLTVRDTLVAAAKLRGQWLGGPLEVFVEPEGRTGAALTARGQASAAQLRTLLGVPATVGLTGAADWIAATKFAAGSRDEASNRSVRIESTLHGLGIALPEPLGKSASDARPLQLTLELDGNDAVLARGSFGSLRSLISIRRSGQGWALDRGGIRADGIAPALPNHRGLRIEGTIDRFVLDEWLALKGSGSGEKRLSDFLQGANVRVGTFELSGYRWMDVRGILQATQAGWRVDVSGPTAAGQILIPESFTGNQPLRATLERLILEKAGGEPGKREARDPRSLPNLQAYVADLRIGQRRIGAVDVKAIRVPDGIRFDSVTINGESARAEAQGEWLATHAGQRSSLTSTVTSSDIAATLRALNYSEFITAKRGELHGDLSWPGGFDGNVLEHASGTLSVRAESGQLLAVQPGAGRVLGLFSLAALPRRLALDFSDLTDKGLAFDTVRGDFELRDGNAYTSNLLLRGPAAEIGIAGRTGLATRDYDQTAVVTGNLGASLPVAGALAAGPAVGAALLLFSQVFKEPLKGITRGYYRITGPWDEPLVERVDAAAIKVSEQKAPGAGD